MTLIDYRDRILGLIVKPWLNTGQSFILKEDGDSGHGYESTNNIVKQWK